jgi:hypothetical protein
LVKQVLSDFHAEWKHWPSREVVHKTSLFNKDELLGCNEALDQIGINSRDLLSVRDSFIRLFRTGQYPPLRGTFLTLDDVHSILYTRGSIDFYQMLSRDVCPAFLRDYLSANGRVAKESRTRDSRVNKDELEQHTV